MFFVFKTANVELLLMFAEFILSSFPVCHNEYYGHQGGDGVICRDPREPYFTWDGHTRRLDKTPLQSPTVCGVSAAVPNHKQEDWNFQIWTNCRKQTANHYPKYEQTVSITFTHTYSSSPDDCLRDVTPRGLLRPVTWHFLPILFLCYFSARCASIEGCV